MAKIQKVSTINILLKTYGFVNDNWSVVFFCLVFIRDSPFHVHCFYACPNPSVRICPLSAHKLAYALRRIPLWFTPQTIHTLNHQCYHSANRRNPALNSCPTRTPNHSCHHCAHRVNMACNHRNIALNFELYVFIESTKILY